MLAEIDESNTAGIGGDDWADQIGTQKASGKADNLIRPTRRRQKLARWVMARQDERRLSAGTTLSTAADGSR